MVHEGRLFRFGEHTKTDPFKSASSLICDRFPPVVYARVPKTSQKSLAFLSSCQFGYLLSENILTLRNPLKLP